MKQVTDLSFVPPAPAGVSGDVGELQRPGVIDVTTDPLEKDSALVVPLDRLLGNSEYAGMYWFRLPLTDNRGGLRQVGRWSRDSGKRSDGALICPAPDYMCLPSLVQPPVTGVAAPPGSIVRFDSAAIFGVELYAGFDLATANLHQETSSTNPTPLPVPGYAPPGGVTGVMCLTPIQVGGVPYLAVGYINSGGANTLQIISSISAFASATVPVGTAGVCGVIQTPIDGSALLVYQYQAAGAGPGMIRAVRTDVPAAGAVVSAIRSTLNGGGAAVGLSAWEGEAAAYWLEPVEGSFWGPAYTVTPGPNDKARLIRTDLRGYLPSIVDVPLRWVTFATRVRGGIVVCDRQTHWFLGPGRRFRRMSVFDDFPANSNLGQFCCGHATKSGRFLIEVNDGRIAAGTAALTSRYLMEWDFDLWEPSFVSAKKTLSNPAALDSTGSNNLPWSPYTGFVTVHTNDTGATGSWWWQFQEALGENLWNFRHTVGSAAGSGIEYEVSETLTTPALVLDGYEDCRLNLIAVTGPRGSLIVEGGTGALVGVEELLSGLTGLGSNGRGAAFNATEPHAAATGDRAQRRIIQSTAWTYGLQFRLTVVRGSTDSDATRKSPNAAGIYIEGIAVRKKVTVPRAEIMRALDAQRGDP